MILIRCLKILILLRMIVMERNFKRFMNIILNKFVLNHLVMILNVKKQEKALIEIANVKKNFQNYKLTKKNQNFIDKIMMIISVCKITLNIFNFIEFQPIILMGIVIFPVSLMVMMEFYGNKLHFIVLTKNLLKQSIMTKTVLRCNC